EAELGAREIAGNNDDPLIIPGSRELPFLERAAQPIDGFAPPRGTDMADDLRARLAQQRRENVAADEARRAGEKDPNGMEGRRLAMRLDIAREDCVARKVRGLCRILPVEKRRELAHRRRRIDGADRKIGLQTLADASAEPNGKERMAAEVEEIVVDAD